MNKRTIIILIAGIVIAAAISITIYALTRSQPTTMSGLVSQASTDNKEKKGSQADVNSSTYKQYLMLTGEDYDKTFIGGMIAHHEGAISMAKLALTNAGHKELKALATDIVAAQTGEASQMQKWQKDWAYPSTNTDSMTDHSAMGMMFEMSAMTDQLKALNGDAFDKKFIELMIVHHQSAIDMAAPGTTNAYHQEVKGLTTAIVNAQSAEIIQMQKWQKDWGYSKK